MRAAVKWIAAMALGATLIAAFVWREVVRVEVQCPAPPAVVVPMPDVGAVKLTT